MGPWICNALKNQIGKEKNKNKKISLKNPKLIV